MSQTLPPGFGDWKGDTKYELRGTLGTGAMGVVLDGFDRAIERRVAIKVVRKPAPDDAEAANAAARFKREAQAAGRLSHPGIVAIHDYGENDGTAWIVMELVEGGTLKALMDRDERLPVREVARIMGQVLGALAYAHAHGVIHRDIKPANVMLTGEGDAKLADFGIARLENSSMTQVGTLMGTPSYMAPEQLRGEALDARADVWAAGVMLYQLLTGEKPFPGGLSAVMHNVLNTEPAPPSALSATVPPAIDAVVLKALSKRPDDRWPDARAFAAAVDTALRAPASAAEDATVVAARPHPAPPAARPPRASRRPSWLWPAAGLCVVAGGAAGFLLWPQEGPRPAQDAASMAAIQDRAGPRLASPPTPDAPEPAQATPPTASPTQADAPRPVAPVPETQPTPSPSDPATQTTHAPPATRPDAPAPGTGQQVAAVPAPRFDWSAIAASAGATAPCGLLSAQVKEAGFRIRGILPAAEAKALRQDLAERNLPPGAAQLELSSFATTFCPLVTVLRPALASPADAPAVTVDGPVPLRKGQLLRLTVGMPGWASHLHVAYATSGGVVARLEPGTPEAPGGRVRLGEPRAGFSGWEIDEPFGVDLLLVVASDAPLFPTGAPQVQEQQAYAADFAAALRAAHAAGHRVALTPLAVDTAAR